MKRIKNAPRYVFIENDANMVRDTTSMGILNTNLCALEEAKKRKAVAMQKIAEQRSQNMELNSLRNDVAELKKMILQLVVKQNESQNKE